MRTTKTIRMIDPRNLGMRTRDAGLRHNKQTRNNSKEQNTNEKQNIKKKRKKKKQK